MLCRLFTVPPSTIFEHPPDLPTDPKRMVEGPIDGWECYALTYRGNVVVGPFTPVIGLMYDDHQPMIEVGPGQGVKGRENWAQFWYHDGTEEGMYRRPCWYQSGRTLRFIKKKGS